MVVTLDIFSGRPNPSWMLSEKNAQQLLERVANKALTPAEAVESHLGFRGLVVSPTHDDGLPENVQGSFRLGGLLPADYAGPASALAGLSADDTQSTIQWLLTTGQHVVPESVLSVVQDTLLLRQQGTDMSAAGPMEDQDLGNQQELTDLVSAASCILQNTAYNPGFWNVPVVQPYNNCYNYAMNCRTNTFAQPGRISGHPYGALTCAAVGAATNWDGCLATCAGGNKQVALVIWPGHDFYWYRRNSEGFWSHKPGSTAVRNVDNAGRVINGATLTPQNCNRGPYTAFCGYRFSPTGMQVK